MADKILPSGKVRKAKRGTANRMETDVNPQSALRIRGIAAEPEFIVIRDSVAILIAVARVRRIVTMNLPPKPLALFVREKSLQAAPIP